MNLPINKARGFDDALSMAGGLFGLGGKTDLNRGNVLKYLGRIYQAKTGGYRVAATFCVFTSGDTTYNWTTVDGEKVKYNLDEGGVFDWGGHVFAITDISATTVTFVNPSNSTKTYTVTWDEFSRIGVGEMAWSTW